MAPKEVREIVHSQRPQADEDILDLIRSTIGQLNRVADRLENYVHDAGVERDTQGVLDNGLPYQAHGLSEE